MMLGFVNNRGLTGDGVCDRHEGGVQSGGHAPYCVVSHNPSEAKGRDHLSERCVGRDDSQSQTGGNAYGDRAAWIFAVTGRTGTFRLLLFVVLRRNGTMLSTKHVCIFYKRLCKHSDS